MKCQRAKSSHFRTRCCCLEPLGLVAKVAAAYRWISRVVLEASAKCRWNDWMRRREDSTRRTRRMQHYDVSTLEFGLTAIFDMVGLLLRVCWWLLCITYKDLGFQRIEAYMDGLWVPSISKAWKRGIPQYISEYVLHSYIVNTSTSTRRHLALAKHT